MTWTTAGEQVTATKLNEVFPHGDDDWTTWTPSYTNLTVGTGATVVAQYIQVGKFIYAQWSATLGTSPSVGDVSVSLPANADTTFPGTLQMGHCSLRDTGTASYAGWVEIPNATTARLREQNVSGSLITTAALSSTSPFTWGAGDILGFVIAYRAA